MKKIPFCFLLLFSLLFFGNLRGQTLNHIYTNIDALNNIVTQWELNPCSNDLYRKCEEMTNLIGNQVKQISPNINTDRLFEYQKLNNQLASVLTRVSAIENKRLSCSGSKNGNPGGTQGSSGNPTTSSNNRQAEQLASGFSAAVKQNDAKDKELNDQIRELETKKDEASDSLKQKQESVFGCLLEKKRLEEIAKKNLPPFNPEPGTGFSRILFDSEDVTLKYTLKLLERRVECTYKNTPRITQCEGKLLYITIDVPFAAYYYEATYEIINKKNQKLGIRGGIKGDPSYRSREHIQPIGPIADCLGFSLSL